MFITSAAKEAIQLKLQEDGSLLPAVTWACDENCTDPLSDGYFGFGFSESNDSFKDHLVELSGLTFLIDIPELLKDRLKTSRLNFVDSKFTIEKPTMALEDKITQLRTEALEQGRAPVPNTLQGVTKDRLREVLRSIDRATDDIIDAVFALLDDEHDSWFTRAQTGTRFCDGASTAHIACHVGILQRGGRKLDREGRDYWLKPLWELGAMEKVYFDSKTRNFLPGHPVAKSPNSAYRLADSFRNILIATDQDWEGLLQTWIQDDQVRQRLELQAQAADKTRYQVDTKHSDLIRACCNVYAPRFLPEYEILYIDESDGDRISEPDRDNFARAGIDIILDDAMPDVLLWNPDTDKLWVIEAVTSDGEVDQHKVNQLAALTERSGKAGIDFTTAYRTWSDAARRQGKHKNIAPGTYIWIEEDPSKHYLAESFEI